MTGPVTSSDLRGQITAANRRFVAAFAGGDAAAVAAAYTTDAWLLPPGGDFVSDQPAIEAFWRRAIGLGIRAARLETIELERQGEVAIEVGRYTLEGDGGRILDCGKYLVIWRPEGGQWKLHRNTWNSSVPPTQG
jgi:ketosteroid isomerase-like protein